MTRPNGGIIGPYIVPGSGQTFGVVDVSQATQLKSAGLFAGSANVVVLAPEDPVITNIVYTDSTFANIDGAISTAANTTGNLKLIGRNFQADSVVFIAGQQSAYTYAVSSSEVRARIPSLPLGSYSLAVASSTSTILSNVNIQTANYPVFTTLSTLAYYANTAISTTIEAIGATSYRISAGSLPGNISFNTSTGALSGTITVNPPPYIAYWNFDVTATNALGFSTVQNFDLIISANISTSYLVVAGGGGGGDVTSYAGGGGAGGFIDTTNTTIPTGINYSIVVGGGGGAAASGNPSSLIGTSPTFTPVSTTAIGGGYGGYSPATVGGNGGSGGGSGTTNASSSGYGLGTPGQGNRGGGGPWPAFSGTGGGGGGGAGVRGIANPNRPAGGSDYLAGYSSGQGGDGLPSSVTGQPIFFAGGGGGSNLSGPGNPGGAGGGGTGSGTSPQPAPGPALATSGGAGTGGGGGGGQVRVIGTPPANQTTVPAGSGGSGNVIINYANPYRIFSGGTIASYPNGVNTNWVHIFSSSGSFIHGPVWQANANVAFTANYYGTTTISSPLRAYNAVSYALAAGNTLPGGITINASSYLTGTVTSENSSFYINATGSSGLVSNKEFSLTYSYPIPTWITSATLPSGTDTDSYSLQLSATVPTGLGSVVYSVSAGNTLPSGMSFSSAGLLTGSGLTIGSYSFYLRASHNIGSNFYSDKQFTLVVNTTYSSTYVVVGGGGGGGSYKLNLGGGGGGGGGVTPGSATLIKGETYTITVGAGGSGTNNAPGFPSNPSGSPGGTGGTTTLTGSPASIPLSATATGGGGGIVSTVAATPPGPSTTLVPLAGGFGGPSGNYPGTGFVGGSGGPAYFQASSIPASVTSGGGGAGGAGAGGAGTNGLGGTLNANGGHGGASGGPGATVTIYGTPRVFGGGGGGTSAYHSTIPSPPAVYVAVTPQGLGGAGGGGNSFGSPPLSASTVIPNTTGGVNLGGGGGGGGLIGTSPTGGSGGQGWHGGSGIAILSVPTPNYTGVYTGANVVVAAPPSAPGQTILTFNDSGTYTA